MTLYWLAEVSAGNVLCMEIVLQIVYLPSSFSSRILLGLILSSTPSEGLPLSVCQAFRQPDP